MYKFISYVILQIGYCKSQAQTLLQQKTELK